MATLRYKTLWCMMLLLYLSTKSLHATTLTIAVASNFAETLHKLTDAYTKIDPRNNIALSIASSGKHFAHIRRGAPYQIFFSADSRYPQLLAQQGFGIAKSRTTYALGHIVLYSSIPTTHNFVDIVNNAIVASEKNNTKIAIAHPKLAPYGIASYEIFNHVGLWSRIQPHLVTGENINQTMLFAFHANVSFALLAYSQFVRVTNTQKNVTDIPIQTTKNTISCQSHRMPVTDTIGYWCTVPQTMYTPIQQQLLLLQENTIARHFINFVFSDAGQAIIASHGYGLPSQKNKPTNIQK